MSFGVRSVIFDVIGRDNASKAFLSASKSAQRAATATERAMARTNMVAARTQAAGQKMAKAITLPALAFAAYGVKQAVELQKQQALLRTAAGVSEANMKQIAGGIKKVSSDTATRLHQLNEGIYVIAKAAKSRGWTGADQLHILRAAAQGAKSENVALGVATDALTTIMVDYHSKVSDAVSVENQLIKASGLAKTNFGLFSESLSNVTPIAASAGLSFAEIGGAVATMTQHGVTAQRATDNLRNLIFNLTGQNNVASQAMQQLGIDTVDLSKNLGVRGLTGTIAIIDDALKKHTKNGLVYVDTQKAAALANRSLAQMIGEMPAPMAKTSRSLLTGKVSLRDYTAYAKSMGGQAGAAALQFRNLYLNSQGFSNQLKSGKSTTLTATQALKQLSGGMTGAAVMMQIGGKYAKDNAKNVRAVGDAASHAGKDVHGWELTQKTLAYKFDNFTNKVSLLATSVGEKLLPALSSAADLGARGFKWFDRLDSGTKKILGIGLAIGVALGPALAITGRLTRGFVILFGLGVKAVQFAKGLMLMNVSLATMNSGAWAAGFKMRDMFSQGISGARAMGSALAGAGIGVSIGMMTRESSTATKAVGALGSAAAGAAAGFAMGGGPWGAAIGGAAGLLGNLAANFLGAGKSARDAIKPTDAYTDALLRSKGAINDTIRAMVSKDIQGKGGYDAGLAIGIDQKTLTDAALGNKTAMNTVRAAQRAYSVASLKGGKDAETWTRALHKLNDVLGDEAKTIEVNRQAAKNLAAANSVAGKNDTARKAALKGVVKMQADAATAMKRFNQQVGVHGASLDPNAKGGSSNAAFLSRQVQSYNRIAAAQLRSGSSLAAVNKGLDANVRALRAQAVAAGFGSAAVDALIGKYKLTPKQIVTNLVANIGGATASAGQLQTVIDNIRQNKVPGLTADSAQGKAVISALQTRINALSQKRPTALGASSAGVASATTAAQNLINRIKQGRVPGIRANTDEAATAVQRVQQSINALTDKTVNIGIGIGVNISTKGKMPAGASIPTDKLRGLFGADGGIVRFFRDGGVDKKNMHQATIAKAGDWRVFAEPETGGESYIPHAPSKRTRSRAILAKTASILGGAVSWYANGGGNGKSWMTGAKGPAAAGGSGSKKTSSASKKRSAQQDQLSQGVSNAISGVGQAYSAPFSLADVGLGRVVATASAAAAKLNAAIGAGLSKKSAAQFRAQLGGLVATANKQLGSLRARIKSSDLEAMRAAFRGTADDTRQALGQVLTDIARAGASSKTVTQLRGLAGRIADQQAKIATEKQRLSDMTDYRSGIADTLRGKSDFTQAGSVDDLRQTLQGGTEDNNSFSTALADLRNRTKGNAALTGFITRLQESGNTATLQTLFGASSADLANISKDVVGYDASVAAGSDAATTMKYGESVSQQAQDVKTLSTKLDRMTDVFGRALVAVANQQVTVVLNGEKVSQQVMRSKAFDRTMAELERELGKR